jgi:hypothetical protein
MAATTYSGATNLQGYPLRLVVDFTQNVAGNYSDVSWNLYLDRPAGQADFSNWQSSWSVNIGGNAYGGYISSYDFRQYSTFWLGTGTTRIYHDASGDALINVSGAFAESHALIGNASVGGSYDLPIIPRASQPTVDKTSIDAGQILTIFTNRASTAFTHTVKYTFGTQTGTVLTNVTDQVQWIPPLSLLTEIPNSTSGTMTITVDTFNGGTFVGWSSTTVTLKVPSSVVPSFSTVTVSENNTTVSTAVGRLCAEPFAVQPCHHGSGGRSGLDHFQLQDYRSRADHQCRLWRHECYRKLRHCAHCRHHHGLSRAHSEQDGQCYRPGVQRSGD